MATNAITTIEICHGDAVAPATIAAEYAPQADDPYRACQQLSKLLAAIGGGVRAAKVRVRVDSSTVITERPTSTIAITHANVTADDTVSVGGATFTWKASASGEDQVTIGANVTADGDNLAAKINAHSKLSGLVSAVNAAGTITITYLCDPRAALNMVLATSDATAHTLTQPNMATATLAAVQTTRTYARGVA